MRRRIERLKGWWQRPTTRRDRVIGMLVGGLGCFWVGLLGRIFVGPMPVSLSTLAWWALGASAVGLMFGGKFPKATIIVCFPLSVFGIGRIA